MVYPDRMPGLPGDPARIAVAPRRFAMERFEAVLYKNEPAFVIGTRGDDDVLLYVPNSADTTRPTARRGDADLVRTNKRLPLASR